MRGPAALALACLVLVGSADAAPLPLTFEPVDNFGSTGADALEFVGGLSLTSSNAEFGGLSGIDMLDADHAVLVGDIGTLVRMRLVRENGRLVGVADGEIESLFPDGMTTKVAGDIEDIAIDPSDPANAVVVRERQANAMLTFSLADGATRELTPKLVGAPNTLLRSNRGLESVAYAPAASPLAGNIITIAEHPPRGESDIPAWIAGVGEFRIVRRDDFDISGARFLPGGDLLLLERYYSPPFSIGSRIRRIPGGTIAVGATVDGEILLDAGMTSQIDNMEGIAVSQDATGRTLITLVSDDNFNFLQRTLLLQFALVED